jgi:hypothetical protein
MMEESDPPPPDEDVDPLRNRRMFDFRFFARDQYCAFFTFFAFKEILVVKAKKGKTAKSISEMVAI